MELQFVPGGCCLAGEQRRESRWWHVSGKEKEKGVRLCARLALCTRSDLHMSICFPLFLFFSKGLCLLSKRKSFVRFLAAGIKKMLKIYVSYVLFLWTHSLVMPLLESFNLIDNNNNKKKIYIFGFISKPVNLCIHLKEQEILALEETEKKLGDTVWWAVICFLNFL